MKLTGTIPCLAEWEPYEFASGTLTIRGVRSIPVDPKPVIVILIHGWGTSRIGPGRLYIRMAEKLNASGIQVYRFDLPGRGESEGDQNTIDLDTMAESVCTCINYIRAASQQPVQVGLAGICSGGNTAIRASLDTETDFMILWSTFTFRSPGRKQASPKNRHIGAYMRKLVSPASWSKLLRGAVNLRLIFRIIRGSEGADTKHLKDSARDVMAAWAAYDKPVLFVYGSLDPEAPASRETYKNFCTEHGIQAEFKEIEGASHNYYREEWSRDVLNISHDFICSCIKSKAE